MTSAADRGRHQQRQGPEQVGQPAPARRWSGRRLRRVGPAQRAHHHHEQHAGGGVDREDPAPGREGQDRGAEQRTQHAAELLHRRDQPERQAAPLDRVERGDQRHRGRYQPAPSDSLEEPPQDHAGQVVGDGGHHRADREGDQRRRQHRDRSAQVGDPADEGQHGDVAEEEPGDDGGRALELIGADPDRAHHVGQRQHHDVGVDRGERDRDRAEDQQRPRSAVDHGGRRAHGAEISCCTS